MSEKVANIARNTSYLTFALIIQKIISFIYFTLIARSIGPEDLGKYYFAISFTTIFAVIIDLGLSNVLTREVAKYNEKSSQFLGNILIIKIPLFIIALFFCVLIVNLLGYSELTRTLVYLSSICMVLDSFTLSFFSAIRGFHNLKYESIGSVIFQLIVFAVVLVVLKLKLSLIWLMLSLVFASIFDFIYSLSLVRFKWKISFFKNIDYDLIKLLLRLALPFAIFAVLNRLYMYLDSVLLSLFADDRYVGYYQIPFKIIFALQFLPMAFIASLYPAFSLYWVKNREQLAITFERAMNYMIIISLPISIGILMLADKIILLFNSGYTEATAPLMIAMVAIIFIFLNFPVGSLLNACDYQKKNTIIMSIILVTSVIMNLFLIPRFQTIGACITVVATNMLRFILGISIVPRIISFRMKKMAYVILKSLLSVSIMSFFILLVKTKINILSVILISGVIYFVILYLLGGYRKEDIVSLYQSFLKKTT